MSWHTYDEISYACEVPGWIQFMFLKTECEVGNVLMRAQTNLVGNATNETLSAIETLPLKQAQLEYLEFRYAYKGGKKKKRPVKTLNNIFGIPEPIQQPI